MLPQPHARQPLVELEKVLVGLLAATAILSVVQALQLFAERGDARDIVIATGPDAGIRMQRAFGPQPVTSLVSLVSFGAAIVWLVWQHRGHTNLRARGVPGLRFTPGWAVGWWFVPLAALVMPYLTMRELWDNAGWSGTGTRTAPARRPVAAWWFVYVASSLVGFGALGALISTLVSFARTVSSMPADQFPTLTIKAAALRQIDLWVGIASLLRAPAAWLATRVVRSISKREDAAPSLGGLQPTSGWVPPRPDLGAPPS
jgi:hypothetical protein